MYEATGKVKVIFDTQTFPSGFTKREFVVTVGDGDYPQDLKFEILKDKCALLDSYEVGQTVKVNFDIRGNEYKEKYYVNLNCWKIAGDGSTSSNGASSQQSAPTQSAPANSSDVEPSANELMNDDIPF